MQVDGARQPLPQAACRQAGFEGVYTAIRGMSEVWAELQCRHYQSSAAHHSGKSPFSLRLCFNKALNHLLNICSSGLLNPESLYF